MAPHRTRLTRYLGVGLVGYVVDVGIFNFLRIASLADPYLAKVISTLLAVLLTFVMNRNWTFQVSVQPGPQEAARLGRYILVHFLGMTIPLAVLFISKQVLGFDSLLAENISANVVGVAFALLFRWTLNSRWVFAVAEK